MKGPKKIGISEIGTNMWVGLETGENMERDSEKMAGVGS
jgi:hypothetical protein